MADVKWYGITFVTGTVLMVKYSAPVWMLILFAALVTFTFFLFAAMFIFFGKKNPDLLRSESYSLSKMQIENSIKGDNIMGYFDPEKSAKLIEGQGVTPPREIE